ncbi:hypothetical protein [Amycolatopsis sp. NPDC098790]|uniref:hypothetical protein n=1 Tax=Amycolatopsis sp. NPDC098790 TaxID=3363939 RepID=UPI00380B00B0
MPETKSNDTKPETTESKVRRALEAHPGATAARLASAAGVGRSTATKILSRLATEGHVTRTDGKDQSVPVTWTWGVQTPDAPVEAADADDQEATSPTLPAPDPVTPEPAATDTSTAETSKKDRLPKGGLYELVKDFLHKHPGEEFGPAKIGTELVRSSGAVNNALEKLVSNGLAKKTCEAPKRFTSS